MKKSRYIEQMIVWARVGNTKRKMTFLQIYGGFDYVFNPSLV